jgi:hypothetical protein
MKRYYHFVGKTLRDGSPIPGGGELVLSFNTQPPQSLDELLRRAGFIVCGYGEYIYRPRKRS